MATDMMLTSTHKALCLFLPANIFIGRDMEKNIPSDMCPKAVFAKSFLLMQDSCQTDCNLLQDR